ncbi:hypothetical protein [Dietzia cinnamea]|uniref:hypothetical protein n=1 Tax=Dietzia cinnamea TaxID=321318 RepID=UPI0021A75B07|nr:hypothetical protein [Dietzia cinnamea]MCT2122564.1 hypothetical protein [Dietzia cinnamea]
MSIQVKRVDMSHCVVLTLDPEEAEAIADALGVNDGAHQELYDAARKCRERDEESS